MIKNSTVISLLASILLTLSACGGGSSGFGGSNNGGGAGGGSSSNNKHSSTGRITKLDHLTVNGVEYNISNTTLTRNGQTVTDTSLFKIGEIITLQREGNTLNNVTFQSQVTGPISVKTNNLIFQVAGQFVKTDINTKLYGFNNLAELSVNTLVEVSGFIDKLSRIQATSITQLISSSIHIEGSIKSLDIPHKVFNINNLRVDFSNITGDTDSYTNGLTVTVAADQQDYNNSILVADSITAHESSTSRIKSNASHTQEGLISSVTNPDIFSINTLPVKIDSQTQFVGGVRGNIGVNQLVRVTGSVISEEFVANKINFLN